MTKKTALTIYAGIAIVLAIQAVAGVWQSGRALAADQQLAELYHQKTELLSTKLELETALAHQHSLLNITSSDVYKEFQPIMQVTTLHIPTTVASR